MEDVQLGMLETRPESTDPYQWKITAHAIKRWVDRMQLPVDILLLKLDGSRRISEKLRAALTAESRSVRHKRLLQRHSGFFYRRNGDILFVLDNLTLVTIFQVPKNFRRRQSQKEKCMESE